MANKYEMQAARIESVLGAHKVPARVWQATVTPRFVRFDVTTALGTRLTKVSSLAEELAFRIAASMAYKIGLERAKPTILEPVMAVEVFSPEAYLGELIADLAGRAGKVEAVEDRHGGKVVRALVALRELFGYTTALRNLSQGRASHTMQFSTYQAVPRGVQERIVNRGRGGR